jgi:2-desacetyl-2-hydroxyethyl bacteriochlorophyllide A dehydrogenase
LHGGFTLGLVKNGGYAEYVKVHKNTVRRLPDELSDIEGAIVEPAAVAFHTLTLSGVDENSRVLITGAGAIGIMAAAGAKALGAAFVGTTARNPARIEMAEKSSFVDYAFDGKDPDLLNKIQEVAGSITHVIECTGVDSMFNFAAEVVTKAGKIVIVAQPSGTFTYPATTLLTKEALVTPSLVYTPADFDMVIDFIKSGKMDIAYLVDSVIGFDAVQETFEAYETGEVAAIKILIDPSI